MRYLVAALLIASCASAHVHVSPDGQTYNVDSYGRKPSREEVSIGEPHARLTEVLKTF